MATLGRHDMFVQSNLSAAYACFRELIVVQRASSSFGGSFVRISGVEGLYRYERIAHPLSLATPRVPIFLDAPRRSHSVAISLSW